MIHHWRSFDVRIIYFFYFTSGNWDQTKYVFLVDKYLNVYYRVKRYNNNNKHSHHHNNNTIIKLSLLLLSLFSAAGNKWLIKMVRLLQHTFSLLAVHVIYSTLVSIKSNISFWTQAWKIMLCLLFASALFLNIKSVIIIVCTACVLKSCKHLQGKIEDTHSEWMHFLLHLI